MNFDVKLEHLDGIDVAYASKLREAGITTTEDLLVRARSRSGRGMLAAASGIPERLIGEWVSHCDLLRAQRAEAESESPQPAPPTAS